MLHIAFKAISIIMAVAVTAACIQLETAPQSTAPAPDALGIRDVTVGPVEVECQGVGPQMCLVMDDELFYSSIEGFDHEPGYHYRLRIEVYDRWGGQEPPADASAYGYRLIEVLEKTRETP